MIKTKEYNQIDINKLIPEKDRLKPGRVATFRLTGMRPNPDTPGTWIIPELVALPATDRIYDYDKGESVFIAAIKQIGGDGKPEFHDIEFSKRNAGTIILNGNSTADIDKFNFLYLCNLNASNPKRDQSIAPRFEYIDAAKDAKKELDDMQSLMTAIDVLSKMDEKEVRIFAESMNWHDESDMVLKARVTVFAKDNPDKFLELAKQSTKDTKAIVNRALRRNKIAYIAAGRKYAYAGSNESILIVPPGKPNERLDFFVNWLTTNSSGKPVLQNLKDILEADKVEVE